MIVKFKMWSLFHYFMITFPFILAFLLYFLAKDKSEKDKRNVGIALSIIMIAILIMRNVFIWIKMGSLNPEVLPLQVCHFANFHFLLPALSEDGVCGTVALCLHFPAGLVSGVFADGLENY